MRDPQVHDPLDMSPKHDEEVREVARRIQSAAEEANTPPAPGETKPFAFATDLLGEDGWSLLWKVVRAVRECDAHTFVKFSELSLALRIADELESDADLDLDSLIAKLVAAGSEFGPRVVSTPICNVVMEASAVRLAEDVVLWRAFADGDAEPTDEDVVANLNLPKWLGARMARPLRTVDLPQKPFDTGRTAALLTIEQGVPALALARARARTQYAIAMWTVLSPPEGWKVLPDVGVWAPQPTVHAAQRHRALRDPEDPSVGFTEEGAGFRSFGMFILPGEEDLRLPFEAMAHVESRGAQAVLSASLHLMAAGRASRLLPSERVRAVMAAIESLGETASGKGARRRFLRLAAHHGTDAVEARGWTAVRVREAVERMRKARNIATHGSDAVLLDLGYPSDAARKMVYETVAGTELAAGGIQSDLPVLVHVVGRTLERTIRQLARDGWEDDAFMSYFAG
jgi:hypothetical protein